MKGYYVATAIFVLAIVGWYVGSRGSDFVGDLPSDVVREAMPEGDQTRRVIPSEGTRVLFGDLGSGLYDFSAVLPVSWEVEVVSDIDALNIYDPELPGESTLEKSQLFLRTFEASQFLTLSTVTIHAREETTISGMPAVSYDIEKKPEVARFSFQPSWRNERHTVTDVRLSGQSPSVFIVIAQRPDLSLATVDAILESMALSSSEISGLVYPIKDAERRVTKKRFGQFVTPENSPVDPERFQGYHTGVDYEIFPDEADVPIPVFAIADGVLKQGSVVDRYGGVVVIEHQIDGMTYTILYGHLNPKDLLSGVNRIVSLGERIGSLGKGYTGQTDGGRKHLHLSVIKGGVLDRRGYVLTEGELERWTDPEAFFEAHTVAQPTL